MMQKQSSNFVPRVLSDQEFHPNADENKCAGVADTRHGARTASQRLGGLTHLRQIEL